MAYESRIMIVNALREKNPKSENFGKVLYADIVADIYLGCMGYNNGWQELFTKEIDFELFAENDEETTKEDKYGKIMKEGNIKTIKSITKNIVLLILTKNIQTL